jgi:hypothetical protein
MTRDLDIAIKKLAAHGYMVRRLNDQSFDIDGRLVATQLEILELAAGMYSVPDLHQRFVLKLSAQK